MNSIPVIGVAIVNGFNWLERLVASIDFPVEKLVIIDNNGKGELTEDLRRLSNTVHPFISKIHLIEMPSNLGVAASWNLLIKTNILAPYWIITNHDIAFTPGLLEEFYVKAQDSKIGMIHGSGGDFGQGAYDLFLIKDWAIQKLGLFDENFYPAYCEDADYIMRYTRWSWDYPEDPIGKIAGLERLYYHGNALSNNSDYYQQGGQTKKITAELTRKLDEVHYTNWEYMNEKWGKHWRGTNPQPYAMGIEGMPITYTTFNLEFAKSKHLGF